MSNYLVEHALQNVWCTPDQDRQHIIRPGKITPPGGVWSDVTVLMKRRPLPNKVDYFHVYQIGQVYPIIVGFLPVSRQWVNFADVCGQEQLILDVYSDKGIRYPNHLIWYCVTEDNNLIVAVSENKKIPIQLNDEALYIRFYSNAYFSSVESSQIDDGILNIGKTFVDMNDILNFQNTLNQIKTRPGKTMMFINGFAVDAINPFSAKAGDVVEVLHDGAAYKVVYLNVRDLQVFDSIKDQRRKYLVHFPDDGNRSIEFFDDVDFYLMRQTSNGTYQGVYYHRNQPDAVRMVTHRDYAIQVPYLVALNNSIPNSDDPEALVLSVTLRYSGYNRPLVLEHNRIHELYKLPDEDVVRALVGIDSGVPNWQATHLEMSNYTTIMGSLTRDITPEMVESAYGYNAISKLIGDTPKLAEISSNASTSGLKEVRVPYGLQTNAVAYEYNQQGLLTAWYNHSAGDVYSCVDNNTGMVEMLSGTAAYGFDENYDITGPIDSKASYRFYASKVVAPGQTKVWKDVTGSSMYAIDDNKFTWLITHGEYDTIVRSDKKILSYDLELEMVDGLLKFPLQQIQTIDGVEGIRTLIIPPGELDIFLNGHTLMEKLDFFMEFPNVVICNKEYLNQPTDLAQIVTIRAKGFCNSNLEYEAPDDVGFIRHGMLSRNNRFDIRDDRVMRIVVDGRLRDRSELDFSEEHSGVSIGNVANGRPYIVRDIVVPMRGLTMAETYSFRNTSLAVDQIVSEYLTIKKPEPQITTPFSITERYQIYSPFCTKLIYDLKSGVLNDPRLIEYYSDDVVLEICQPYMYLMAFDPCRDDNLPDDKFVIVHPHHLFSVIDLNAFAYKFLGRAVRLILRDRVNLSHFVRISD